MRYLGRYDVLAVAARVLQCESEAAVRRTDLDAVDRVLADVRRTSGLAEATGVLLAGLVRERPFDGANRVVAVAVVLQFTSLNRAELRLEPIEEVDDLLDRITAGEISVGEVAEFLRARLEHAAFAAEDLQEQLRIELLLETDITQWADDLMWRGIGMFERFSDPARRVVVLAQEEARKLDHVYIGTEHLLLGLIEEEHGIAAKALGGSKETRVFPGGCGISAAAVRDLIVEIVGRGHAGGTAGSIPFTPRAKSTFEYAWDEARRRGADKLDTEHLLLGLLRDGEGVAGQILTKLTADPDQVRRKVQDWIERRQRVESAVTGMLADDSATWTTYGRRHHLLAELNAVLEENERLHEQVARLRGLLRHHDIDPDA
ncbi:MAG TPA: Clp protease N-terminal domain-containing protein [Kribbella sp.]|nr:Clp protease N-terminal domain-containing protein [Kribbella sp.]